MNRKQSMWLGLLTLSLVVLIVIFFVSKGGEKIKPAKSMPSFLNKEDSHEPPATQTVTLFFVSEEDSLLHPEEREIIPGPSLAYQARQLIEELLKGSRNGLISPFPPEVKLRELYLTEGIAYVDFSGDLKERHPSGSSSEISTVYSVVDSLAYNFKTIKKVFILINGDEKETLAGHLGLARPFVPRFDLIAQ